MAKKVFTTESWDEFAEGITSLKSDIAQKATVIELTSVQDAITELSDKHDNIQNQVNECFQSVSDGKALIASAITDKKVPTDATDTFETMANNINSIVCGSGNATTSDVLSDKTFTNDDGIEYIGTMTNNGAISQSLNCGDSYTIPKGYHDGTGSVTANSLASQTDGDATATNILSGKIAYVDGSKITGTMTNKGGTSTSSTFSLDSTNSRVVATVPANGYYNTSSKLYASYATIRSLIGLTAAKIVKGNTILGLAGTAKAAATSQSGSFTFAVNASKTTEYQIKFSDAFASTSYTLVCTVTSGNYKDYITITTKTKLASGATVNVKNSHTGSQATGTIKWIAE